ncbi:MAG: hypothetical protein BGO51_15630 [Rhodospirillales bacterium 69-11]|nr:MAG: hypothetical protein BGO51_15630 [Rhodospirillales bacterium 69-11]
MFARKDLFGRQDNIISGHRIYEDNAIAIRENQITRLHDDIANNDGLIKAVLDGASARRNGNRLPRVDRKSEFDALVHVAARTIDNDSGNTLLHSAAAQETAPSGCIQSASMLNNYDIALVRRQNCAYA